MRKSSRALRWASLVLVMATVAKVFLHDLGELRDLYRVASLLGLAISLIIVSLAYQRLVLGSPPLTATPPDPGWVWHACSARWRPPASGIMS